MPTALYDAIVGVARRPHWYVEGRVADTLDGRFDMVSSVLALVLLRLETLGEAGRGPSARLTELFITDMDGQLRQRGIGDLVVGKHIGRMMGQVGGRLAAYRDGLATGGDLAGAIDRNIYRGAAVPVEASAHVEQGLRALGDGPGDARSGDDPERRRRMSAAPEFSRPVRLDTIGEGAFGLSVTADETERDALARRFDLQAIASLDAEATLKRTGEAVLVEGRLRGVATQSCVATGEPVPARIDEPFALRFEPAGEGRPEDLELDEGDLDVIPYEGSAVDLGEAVAQSFALALDPFPRIADADMHLRAAGVLTEEEAEAARVAASPFAALKRPADE